VKFVVMSKAVLGLLFFVFLAINVSAQIVFITKNKAEAKYIVYITTKEYEADWIILKTKWQNLSGKGIWVFAEYKTQSDFSIYITTKKYEANKIIFFTEFKSQIRY
jgi:hypothetical protein